MLAVCLTIEVLAVCLYHREREAAADALRERGPRFPASLLRHGGGADALVHAATVNVPKKLYKCLAAQTV